MDRLDHRRLSVFLRRLAFHGQEVDGQQGGNLPDHAIFGFWSPEREGTWMAGPRAALAFELPDQLLPRRIEAQLDAHPFREAFASCTLRLRTPQGHRGRLTITGAGLATVTLYRPLWGGTTRLVIGDLARLQTRWNVSESAVRPRVSIIIPHRDKPLLTRLAACACASSDIRVPFEILCVDDGSTPENIHMMNRAEVPIRSLDRGVHGGFAAACRDGADAARGDYLLFVNNDAFLQPGAVQEMLRAFDTNFDCGATGPVLLNMDDSLQEAGCGIQADGLAVRLGRNDPGFRRRHLPRFKTVDYTSGACLMVRRDVFLAMGGFSSKYNPAYYEDTDFCLRLLMRGKRAYLASRASCYHIENATSRDIENGTWAARTSEAHRVIFLQDWGRYLASRNPADFPKL